MISPCCRHATGSRSADSECCGNEAEEGAQNVGSNAAECGIQERGAVLGSGGHEDCRRIQKALASRGDSCSWCERVHCLPSILPLIATPRPGFSAAVDTLMCPSITKTRRRSPADSHDVAHVAPRSVHEASTAGQVSSERSCSILFKHSRGSSHKQVNLTFHLHKSCRVPEHDRMRPQTIFLVSSKTVLFAVVAPRRLPPSYCLAFLAWAVRF